MKLKQIKKLIKETINQLNEQDSSLTCYACMGILSPQQLIDFEDYDLPISPQWPIKTTSNTNIESYNESTGECIFNGEVITMPFQFHLPDTFDPNGGEIGVAIYGHVGSSNQTTGTNGSLYANGLSCESTTVGGSNPGVAPGPTGTTMSMPSKEPISPTQPPKNPNMAKIKPAVKPPVRPMGRNMMNEQINRMQKLANIKKKK